MHNLHVIECHTNYIIKYISKEYILLFQDYLYDSQHKKEKKLIENV